MKPNISVLYCDDIRQELGGKLSYMGVYHQRLLLEALPAVLPKLCVRVQVSVPAVEVNFDKVTIRILHDDQIVGEGVFEYSDQCDAESSETVEDSYRFITLKSHFAFSPFVINTPSALKVRVLINDQEFRGASLDIARAPEGTEFAPGL